MERALLDGEWAAQSEKHSQEVVRQAELRRQLTQLDKEVAHFSAREIQRQAECQVRLEAASDKLSKYVVWSFNRLLAWTYRNTVIH